MLFKFIIRESNYFVKLSLNFRYGNKLLTAVLSPVYPKVLENTNTEYELIPVQYIEPAKFDDIVVNSEPDKGHSKFLEFTLKNLKFRHHHEFCLEELLSIRLADSYNEYNDNERSISELNRDIKVSRETRDSLKEDIEKISAKQDSIRFDETIRKYTAKLLQLKEQHFKMLGARRELIHNICSIWSDIIMVREKSGCTKTPYVLIIEQATLDSETYENEWTAVFNTEFADMLDQLEYDYVSKYLEYKNEKATKCSKRTTKPKLEFDEEDLKTEVEVIVNKTVAKEKIDIILKRDNTILTDTKKSRLVKSKSFYFKIYVDDLFVCESESYESSLTNKFNVEFTESFSVQILPQNSIITIELYEQDESVSFIKVNLNNVKVMYTNADYKTEVLTYNTIVEPNQKHVGSGHNIKEIAAVNKLRLKSSNLFKGNLYTTYEISLQMGWNEKLSENDTEAVKSSMEIGRQLKRLIHGVEKPSIEVLKNIIEHVYDKNIDQDEEMINMLSKICKLELQADYTIPIDEKSPESVRLKLLHLRNSGGFANIENKTVPLLGSQISTEQLNCLQKSIENEFEVQHYDKHDMDPVEVQRYIGAKYVEKLNKNMLKNLSEFLLKKTHKDVVRDFKDLSLRFVYSQSRSITI